MLARELGVVGLINVQFAIFEGEIYILEVNPRASRTIPFVSKAIGVPLAKLAARVMAGKKLAELGFTAERIPDHVSVKESVFPFVRFPGVDTLLGPEMKSTGEVMGIDGTFAMAFAKAELAASTDLPASGSRLPQRARRGQGACSNRSRAALPRWASSWSRPAAPRAYQRLGIECADRNKVAQGSPHVVDLMREGQIAMVINTPDAAGTADSFSIRRTALELRLPFFTTMAARRPRSRRSRRLGTARFEVRALQDYHSNDRAGQRLDDRRRKTAAHRPAAALWRINFPYSHAMPLEMQTALSALSGVGPKRAAALADRGIATVADLLSICRCTTRTGASARRLRNSSPDLAVVEGTSRRTQGAADARDAMAADGDRLVEGAGGARIRVVWFNLPAYMKGRMPDGEPVVMHGQVSEAPDRGLEIMHPEVYRLDSGAPPAVRPVYGLPSEIGQRVYAGLVAQALVAIGGRIEGAMPTALRAEAGVMRSARRCGCSISRPPTLTRRSSSPETAPAHFALAFDEMFAFQLAMGIDRIRATRRVGARMDATAVDGEVSRYASVRADRRSTSLD